MMREEACSRVVCLAVPSLAALVLACSSWASTSSLTVCSTGPPNCQYATIADALVAASPGDTIQIASGSYAGGFTIAVSVTLVGAGATTTTINGGSPVVTIPFGASVGIRSVTIGAGSTGIDNRGALTLRDSTVSGNSSAFGGGLLNEPGGTVTLRNSVVSGNSAGGGGGIFNAGGTVTLRDSLVNNNTAGPNFDGFGGGIYNFDGFGGNATLTLRHSAVRNNSATVGGGGIENFQGGLGATVTLDDSTVSGNTAGIAAGGIDNAFGTVTLNESTISGNSAGTFAGGIYNFFGTLTLNESTVSGNTPDDCVPAPC
jgi:hypothetical protein